MPDSRQILIRELDELAELARLHNALKRRRDEYAHGPHDDVVRTTLRWDHFPWSKKKLTWLSVLGFLLTSLGIGFWIVGVASLNPRWHLTVTKWFAGCAAAWVAIPLLARGMWYGRQFPRLNRERQAHNAGLARRNADKAALRASIRQTSRGFETERKRVLRQAAVLADRVGVDRHRIDRQELLRLRNILADGRALDLDGAYAVLDRDCAREAEAHRQAALHAKAKAEADARARMIADEIATQAARTRWQQIYLA